MHNLAKCNYLQDHVVLLKTSAYVLLDHVCNHVICPTRMSADKSTLAKDLKILSGGPACKALMS